MEGLGRVVVSLAPLARQMLYSFTQPVNFGHDNLLGQFSL
jgi:hypothetical protein